MGVPMGGNPVVGIGFLVRLGWVVKKSGGETRSLSSSVTREGSIIWPSEGHLVALDVNKALCPPGLVGRGSCGEMQCPSRS
jgi:hypothetical protein